MICLKKFLIMFMLCLLLLPTCGKRIDIKKKEEVKIKEKVEFPKADFKKPARLNLLVWYDFIPKSVFKIFKDIYGIEVIPTLVKNNQMVWEIMQNNPRKYDLFFISNHTVKRMIKAGYLHRLNHDDIKNLKFLEEEVFYLPYDRGLRYTVPITKGCVGITFNINYVPGIPRTWGFVLNAIKNNYLNFRIGIRNEYRFALGLVLIYLGYSPNTTDPAKIEKAKEILIKNIVNRGMILIGPESIKKLINNELLLALDWNGNAAAALEKNYNIRFLLPEEKVIVSYENIVINSKTKYFRAAELFINFLLIPQISALITNYNYFATCNVASLPFLRPTIRNGPGFLLPAKEDMVLLKDMGDYNRLYEEAWKDVLKAKPSPHVIKLPLPEIVRRR